MNDAKMINEEYIRETLGVSKATAYRIIRELNAELERSGCRVIKGKVSLRYFEQQYFAMPGCSGGGDENVRR